MKLELYPLLTPLNTPVVHASKSRTTAESVFVTAASGGFVGLGEGCPRSYVTGETMAEALAWGATVVEACAELHDLATLDAWRRDHHAEIDRFPGAWCAIEMALLDCMARAQQVRIEDLLGVTPRDVHTYTAVLFDAPTPAFEAFVGRFAKMGFQDWKFRVCGDLDSDRARLAALRAAGAARIRIDANNRWAGEPDVAAQHLGALLGDAPVWALEEPVAPRDVAGHVQLCRQLGVAIVLDESACRLRDLDVYDAAGVEVVVNVKVSKCGGLLRSLEMVRAAQARGWPVIVGAQVGETSVLTRAAMVVASAAGASLAGQEGAAGTLLLQEEHVAPTLQFGGRGQLVFADSGLGPCGLGLFLIGRDA